jgi:hypothetical protein
MTLALRYPLRVTVTPPRLPGVARARPAARAAHRPIGDGVSYLQFAKRQGVKDGCYVNQGLYPVYGPIAFQQDDGSQHLSAVRSRNMRQFTP